MAKILDEMPGNSRGRTYPWSEWLDGQVRQLTKGEDYDGDKRLRVAAYNTATRMGCKVSIHTIDENSVALVAKKSE